eukprot:scaffold310541_cov34-Prasinocladus_malaysianus.AAC.1
MTSPARPAWPASTADAARLQLSTRTRTVATARSATRTIATSPLHIILQGLSQQLSNCVGSLHMHACAHIITTMTTPALPVLYRICSEY